MSYAGAGNQVSLGQDLGSNTNNRASDVVGLASGDYAVVWASGNDGQGQLLNADGSPDGAVFEIVPEIRNLDDPAVAAMPDGSFVVTWTEQIDSDYAEGQIVGAFFDASGQQLGYFLGNNATIEGQQEAPDIAVAADGRVFDFWSDYSVLGVHVTGREISSGGAEVRVLPTSDEDVQFNPTVAALRDGRFLVAYVTEDNGGFGIGANFVEAGGGSLASYQLVNTAQDLDQSQPQVAALARGGYVIAWNDESGTLGDAAGLSIKAQMFAADGSRVGVEFLVNSTTPGSQYNPSVTGLADGGFAIAWQSDTPNGGLDIFAQAFDAEGHRDGGELLVNTVTAGDQYDPHIAAGAGGGFVVTWTSGVVNVGSGVTVNARVFAPDDNHGPDIVGGPGGEPLTGTSRDEAIYGLGGNDRLSGNGGNDTLDGGPGADYTAGGAGNDTYYLSEVGDTIYEAVRSGIDTVVSAVNYTLGGNLENLQLAGSANLAGSGNGLDNEIIGNSGANSLQGLAGNDYIDAGGGNDTVNGGAGNDILIGGSGIDLLSYKVGATSGAHVDLSILTSQNTIGAGYDKVSGFENLEGSIFNDVLAGDAGANKISGLDGHDSIFGGGGNDDLSGGGGYDSFIFSKASENGFDTIRDFENGVDGLEFARADYAIRGSAFSFDTASHILYWDIDGSGVAAAVALARIYSTTGNITSQDILIS